MINANDLRLLCSGFAILVLICAGLVYYFYSHARPGYYDDPTNETGFHWGKDPRDKGAK